MSSALRPGAVPAGGAVLSRARAATAMALLLGLQPVTTDLYLPALPALTRELAAPMSAAQLTMSALILAFGVAQLFWGPVADRFGRRPVLLAGLALYVVASIGSVLAPDIGWLVAWRALQGACMAAAVVGARAMVRDLYEPVDGAHVMSLALSGLGVLAVAAPVLGGLAAGGLGWRAALAIVAAFGVLTFGYVAWQLPETLAQRNPAATRPGPLLRAWADVARHRDFVAWTALMSCSYGGLFTILAGSSFVYIERLGLAPGDYGLAMASGSLAYLLGTFVCRRWIARRGMAGAVARGAWFSAAGGALTVAAALADTRTPWALLVPQWLYIFGHGIHQPCAQAGAVGPFPQAAGAAAALAGFVLAATAFGVGRWLGGALDGTLVPYALGVGFWAAATTLAARLLVPRTGRPAHR